MLPLLSEPGRHGVDDNLTLLYVIMLDVGRKPCHCCPWSWSCLTPATKKYYHDIRSTTWVGVCIQEIECYCAAAPCWLLGGRIRSTSITLFYRSQPRHRPPALTVLSIAPSIDLLSVCPGLIFFVVFSFFYVLTVVLLKGMGESFLLSKDEPLTPNIDGVVALWISRS